MEPLPTTRLQCSATLSGSSLKIVRVKHDGSLWLVNPTTADIPMSAKELFGFNVGTFSEVPTGLRFPKIWILDISHWWVHWLNIPFNINIQQIRRSGLLDRFHPVEHHLRFGCDLCGEYRCLWWDCEKVDHCFWSDLRSDSTTRRGGSSHDRLRSDPDDQGTWIKPKI